MWVLKIIQLTRSRENWACKPLPKRRSSSDQKSEVEPRMVLCIVSLIAGVWGARMTLLYLPFSNTGSWSGLYLSFGAYSSQNSIHFTIVLTLLNARNGIAIMFIHYKICDIKNVRTYRIAKCRDFLLYALSPVWNALDGEHGLLVKLFCNGRPTGQMHAWYATEFVSAGHIIESFFTWKVRAKLYSSSSNFIYLINSKLVVYSFLSISGFTYPPAWFSFE